MTNMQPLQWAKTIIESGDFVVWDTETTGLGKDAAIVSIGIVDSSGNVLVDEIINPGIPIPADATRVHGITDEMVVGKPTFLTVYPAVFEALNGRRWIIYNKEYDIPRLQYECERYGVPYPQPLETHCAMAQYAIYWGAWSEWHGSYTWQRLSNAAAQQEIEIENAHNAIADAQTTLALVQKMASLFKEG